MLCSNDIKFSDIVQQFCCCFHFCREATFLKLYFVLMLTIDLRFVSNLFSIFYWKSFGISCSESLLLRVGMFCSPIPFKFCLNMIYLSCRPTAKLTDYQLMS